MALPRIKRRHLERLADEELMPLVAQQDTAAFDLVYERHGAAAYSLAFRVVGNARGAEDVTQEAFMSLWRTGARYDRARGSVRNWILSIVRNRGVDMIRREASQRVDAYRDPDDVLATRASPERTDEQVEERDTAERVRSAVGELPDDQARVIELAYFGGFSHSEIAEMLDMPLGTVKGRMRLALEKMRGQLVGASP